jgi:hypothetical protein
VLKPLYKKTTQLKLPIWLKVLLSVLIIATTILINQQNQNFCRPVLWFLVLLVTISLSFTLFPLFSKYKKAQWILASISSLMAWVYVFGWVFSINGLYNDGLLPIGILYAVYLLFFPSLILFISICRVVKLWSKVVLVQLAILHTVTFIFVVSSSIMYQNVANEISNAKTIEQLQEIKNKNFINNYFTERIIGLHFIYHTRLCVYDGWRPPLLDPIIAMGAITQNDPLSNKNRNLLSDLNYRIKLYETLYPDKSIVKKCACSPKTPSNYFEDLKEYD